MKPVGWAGQVAEVLRLRLVEDISVRQIARELHMSRRTVRTILGRHSVMKAPRGSFLDAHEPPRSVLLDNGPVTLAPVVPT
jgi:hypothetical protein